MTDESSQSPHEAPSSEPAQSAAPRSVAGRPGPGHPYPGRSHSTPDATPSSSPGTYRVRLHTQRVRAAVAAGAAPGPDAAWRPLPTPPPLTGIHLFPALAPAFGPDAGAARVSPDGSVARRAFGPDGPGDEPSYEHASADDREGLGDAASLRSRWANSQPTPEQAPIRLRDRLPGRRRLLQLGIAMLALVVLGTAAGSGLLYARADLTRTNSAFTSNNTTILYGDGKAPLATLRVQNRTTIPYAEMPQSVKDAAIAAENRTYWKDQGVSVAGMARAVVAMATGKQVQGGSTITQQYAKLVYLSADRTVTRKAREIAYALKLSRTRSKQEVLGDYLNTVFFGRDAYGVQAASRAWFGKDAKKLTIGESAVLAAVIQNSSILDPAIDPDNLPRLQARYEYVLSGMLEMGTITRAQYDQFHDHLPALHGQTPQAVYTGPQGFLVNMVEQELTKIGFDEQQINGGGLRVTTTFDKAAQQGAEASAQKYEDRAAARSATGAPRADLHAAIASVDSHTGAVLALYGGDDFVKNSRNWATTPRMTGSTFKAFGAVAGLRDGFTLRSTFNGNTFQLDKQPMPVRNEFNTNYGSGVSLLYATQESINTAFVDMVHQMQDGPQKVMKAANDAGAPKGPGWGNYDRMVLGEPEVSPLAMASAYATITNGGMRYTPHVVSEVRDMHGKVLYSADPRGEQTIEPDIARDTTYALEQVTRSGTGARAAQLGRPVAGKTGTAGVQDKIFAGWFIGATTRVSTAVMYVAGNDGQGDLDPYAAPGARTFFGGDYPALTWLDSMEVTTKDHPYEDFPPPAYTARPRLRG